MRSIYECNDRGQRPEPVSILSTENEYGKGEAD